MKVDLIICDLCVRMVFQIRAKPETHWSSYVVDVTAERTDKLENDSHSV